MNTAQRFQLTEEEIAKQASQEIPVLPILNREAGVILDGKSEGDDDVSTKQRSPVCVIVVGMAGSGKTTLMAQLQRSLRPPDDDDEEDTQQQRKQPKEPTLDTDNAKESSGNDADVKEYEDEDDDQNDENDTNSSGRVGYCLNLDPATKLVPFGASIDIRDTVDYKEVMLQHQLGPNGAIMTSLNLFATKFDQVMHILERRSFPPSPVTTNDTPAPSLPLDYILVDTPGQIEAFTWSASGTIMTSALASSFPTVLAFVVDTPRCASSPSTFMSNMLYACSMMYRTRLPVLIVFNKIDVVPHQFCEEWMTDYGAFQEALDEFQNNNSSGGSSGYYGSLTRSLSLTLDEFYSTLLHVGVSAATGEGVSDFWDKVTLAAKDFQTGYLEDLKGRMEEQEVKKRVVLRESMRRLKKDTNSRKSKKADNRDNAT